VVHSVSDTLGCVQAVKQMETLIAYLRSSHKWKATDPQMEAAWEAKAKVHDLCGDSDQAYFCHRQALRCKSNLAKGKGTTQKGRSTR
jgi:hypothetical protein